MQTGFGGVTNFNYNSKHLGVFGHYDYFNSDFKNTDLGFLFGRNNKTQVNGGFNLEPAGSAEGVPQRQHVHERLHAVERRRLLLDKSCLRRRRRSSS